MKLFFRDIDDAKNLNEGKTYHAAGLVESVNEPSPSGKYFCVRFVHPFTGDVECRWRAVGEIVTFEAEPHEWDALRTTLARIDALANASSEPCPPPANQSPTNHE